MYEPSPDRPQQLIICRGLPASGKSTWAKEEVAKRKGQLIRVNRDDLRAMRGSGFSKENERWIRDVRDQAILKALERGFDVVVDDTNLDPGVVAQLQAVASPYQPEIIERFFDTPLEECLTRNARRKEGRVPQRVIREMHRKYLWKEIDRHQYRMIFPALPMAIICDLDGTLAILNGRDPYDASTCEQDRVNTPVLWTLMAWCRHPLDVTFLFMSARMDTARAETVRWLGREVIPHLDMPRWQLFMRKAGDTRRDEIVKRELFDQHVEGEYNVLVAFDDRDRVVRLWRSLGIATFQVAEGGF